MFQTSIHNDAVLTQKFSSLPMISRDVLLTSRPSTTNSSELEDGDEQAKQPIFSRARTQTPHSIYLSCDQSYRLNL
ncbi:MAG: hypothetical protein NZL83_04495 [Candidatus Absconditabacterales bacterium]|nr:hypothetical protein [Candidatus Absconditabacterales bacterium]